MKRFMYTIILCAFAITSCGRPAIPPSAAQPVIPSAVPPPSTPTPNIPTATTESQPNSVASLPLLQQAQAANAERYQYAVEQGAQILPTTDGKSFYVLWLPANSDPANPPPIIVSLHGHGSWAFDEFFLWHSYAVERGYGILALQWWFGGGEEVADYYLPQQMYPVIENALRENHVQSQTVLLHGFSRGSANSYGLVALDRASGNNFFLLTVSNSGGATRNFPPNQSIERGDFGAQPFANTHWVMVCGMNDPNPDRDGCSGMRTTRDWVTQYGGAVDLLIEDPNGDHGAFHRNPANVNAALDVFAQLLK